MSLYAKVKKQKLEMFDDFTFRSILSTMEGKTVKVSVSLPYKQRSLGQNALYWGYILPPIAEFCGYESTVDLHEDLKQEFNPVASKLNPDKVRGGSTKIMNTSEFKNYCDKVVSTFSKKPYLIRFNLDQEA